MAETPEEKDLFKDEPEITTGPTLDDKLNTIIDMLKKHHQEHQELRKRLDKIEKNQKTLAVNQDAICAAWQQVGTRLGELEERCDERHAPRPVLLAAEMASKVEPK